MLNIYNDDLVPLKFFWKDKYEQLSLNIWYELTRNDSNVFFDVGAHTGIYSIIGNLNKYHSGCGPLPLISKYGYFPNASP